MPLIPDLHHFPERLSDATEVFLARIQLGQSPEALIIKCSLLNENPELI